MKKEDFEDIKYIVELYQKISLSNYLTIICKDYKSDIKVFNEYILGYLENNQNTELKAKTQSRIAYCEKINQFYHEKNKSFYTTLFSTLIVLGTFAMVIVSYFALTK